MQENKGKRFILKPLPYKSCDKHAEFGATVAAWSKLLHHTKGACARCPRGRAFKAFFVEFWGFPLRGFPSTIKNMYRANIQSVPSSKCANKNVDVVPGCCPTAAHDSSADDGSDAENRFRCKVLWTVFVIHKKNLLCLLLCLNKPLRSPLFRRTLQERGSDIWQCRLVLRMSSALVSVQMISAIIILESSGVDTV